MGNILKAIEEDEERYLWLCERYGEKPRTTRNAAWLETPDCYGSHAKSLEERFENERKSK